MIESTAPCPKCGKDVFARIHTYRPPYGKVLIRYCHDCGKTYSPFWDMPHPDFLTAGKYLEADRNEDNS